MLESVTYYDATGELIDSFEDENVSANLSFSALHI